MNSSKKNPPREELKHNFLTAIATIGPLGFAPKAPGTWGSLVGLLLTLGIYQLLSLVVSPASEAFLVLFILILFALSALAFVAIAHTERKWNIHDASCIIIDEVVAQSLVVLWWPPSLVSYGLGFALFRFFDIAKPWPINLIDRKLPGAYGTLLDDIAAGFFALFSLYMLKIMFAAYI